MPLKKWRKLTESVVSRNPWWTYRKDTFELPTGKPGETEEFELVRATPAEIEENIGNGGIRDGMTIAAWGIAKWSVGPDP